MALMTMTSESKLLTIVALVETGAVVFAYLFSIAFGQLTMPASIFSEVMREKGLFLLLLPVSTGIVGAALIAKGRQQYLVTAIVVLAGVTIAGFIAFVAFAELVAAANGPRM